MDGSKFVGGGMSAVTAVPEVVVAVVVAVVVVCRSIFANGPICVGVVGVVGRILVANVAAGRSEALLV